MVDAPPEEVVALLDGGPDQFIATRTRRVRALRVEGRREEAAALAEVRKPRRLTWVLIDVRRSRPELVTEVVDAAEALALAQAGGGGRVRPLLTALRRALDHLAEAAVEVAPGRDGAQAALMARQVVGDADARRAWAEGRLLAPPEPDTEGGIDASAPSLPQVTAPSPEGGDRRPRPRTAREASSRDERAARIRAADEARDGAAATLDRLESELRSLDDQIEELRARRDRACAEVDAARDELAERETRVVAARGHDDH